MPVLSQKVKQSAITAEVSQRTTLTIDSTYPQKRCQPHAFTSIVIRIAFPMKQGCRRILRTLVLHNMDCFSVPTLTDSENFGQSLGYPGTVPGDVMFAELAAESEKRFR